MTELNANENEAIAWMRGLVGDKTLSPDSLPRLVKIYGDFCLEKNQGGGCSSCRLRRLNRKYIPILGAAFP